MLYCCDGDVVETVFPDDIITFRHRYSLVHIHTSEAVSKLTIRRAQLVGAFVATSSYLLTIISTPQPPIVSWLRNLQASLVHIPKQGDGRHRNDGLFENK